MGHRRVYKLVRETNTKFINTFASLVLVTMSLGGALPAFITATAHAAGTGDVWITAAMVDPNSGAPEYIQLTNKSGHDIDFDGWKINSHTLSDASGAFSLATGNNMDVCAQSDVAAPCTPNVTASGLGLSNTGDTFSLYDSGNTLVDQVSYTAGQVSQGTPVTFSHAATPDITNVDAYYNDSSYKGIGVDITTQDLTDATGVTVAVNRADGSTYTETAKQSVIDTLNQGSKQTVTAPVVITDGTYKIENSGSWNAPTPSGLTWNTTTEKPVSVTVTITRSGGPNLTLTDSTISNTLASYNDVMPVPANSVSLVSRTTNSVTLKITAQTFQLGDLSFSTRVDGGTVNEYTLPASAFNNASHSFTIGPISATRYVEFSFDTIHQSPNPPTHDSWQKFDVLPSDTSGPTIVVNSSSPANGDYLSGNRYTRQGQPDQQRNRFIFNVTDPSGVKKVAMYVTNHATGVKVKEYALTQHTTHTEQWYADVDTTQFADGTYDISARAVDNANNARYFNNRRDSYSVTIDNTDPSAHITTPSNGSYTQGNFTVKGAASDNLSGIDHVQVYVAHNPWSQGGYVVKDQPATWDAATGTFTYDTSNIPEGTYVVKAVAYDKAGNSHFANTVNITVDNTAPTVTISPDSGYIHAGQNNFTVTVKDNNPLDFSKLNDVVFTLDGHGGGAAIHAVSGTDGKQGTGLFHFPGNYANNGGHLCLYSNVADAAGNKTAKPLCWDFNVDIDAPTVSVTPAAGSLLHGTETFNITINDNNPASSANKYTYVYLYNTVDGSQKFGQKVDLSSGTGTFTVNTKNLNDGNYNLDVGIVKDAAGNPSGVKDSYFSGYTIDNTAPTITVKDGYVGNKTLHIFSNVSFNLYDKYKIDYVSINGHVKDLSNAVYSNVNYQNIKQFFNQGQNTITLYDVTGNSSSYTFIYDSVNPYHPTNLKVNGQSGTFYTQVGAPFTQTWHDKSHDVVGYNYVSCYVDTMPTSNNCNGTSYTTNTTSPSKQVNSGDTHHDETFFWQVQAVDAAGNVSGWSTWSEVVVDSTKPHVSGSTEPSTNPSSLTITATDATPGSGIDSIVGNVYKYDESQGKYVLYQGHSSTTDNPHTVDLSGLADGTYYVKYNAHDKSGNVSNTEKFNFTVDHTAPLVDIISYGQNNNVVQPTVSIDGSTTPTGYTYSWSTDPDVTISNANALNPTFTANADGTYNFTLTVTDAAGNTGTDSFSFTYTTPPSPQTTPPTPAFTNITTTNPGNGGGTTTLNNNGTGTTTPRVLGDKTAKPNDVKGDSTTKLNNQPQKISNSNFLGLGWWWLLILAIILGFIWFLAGRRRSEKE